MQKLEEIEYSINTLYRNGENSLISYKGNNEELIRVNSHVAKWYLVLNSSFSNISHDLHFSVNKSEPFIMMYFQLKGNSVFISDTNVRVCNKSHSLNYLPGVSFNTYVHRHTDIDFFCVKIFPDLLLQHASLSEEHPLVDFCRRRDAFITLHNTQVINSFIYQCIYEYLNCPYKGALGNAYKDNLILNLFIQQLSVFTSGETNAAGNCKLSRADLDTLHNIREYLDNNYIGVTSLHQLTRKFCINSFKLKHGFKHLFKSPVMKYVDDHKMNYALAMLKQGNIPVNDIADELGYQHYNNFSTAFKKRFGCSPASVRC